MLNGGCPHFLRAMSVSAISLAVVSDRSLTGLPLDARFGALFDVPVILHSTIYIILLPIYSSIVVVVIFGVENLLFNTSLVFGVP